MFLAAMPVVVLATALLWVWVFRDSGSQPPGEGRSYSFRHDNSAGAALTHQSGTEVRWPDSETITLSRQLSYKALLRQWGFVYRTLNDATFCSDIQLLNLQCLHAKGSLRELQNLNRPAVLKLLDSEGKEFYVTLISLEGQNAQIFRDRETLSVAVMELLSQWSGDYTMLWRMPPDYEREIRPGDRGPVVLWLEEKLATAQDRNPQVDKDIVFNTSLLNNVRGFQRANGLVPDGIVGPMTLIRLSSATGAKDPVLTDTRKGI